MEGGYGCRSPEAAVAERELLFEAALKLLAKLVEKGGDIDDVAKVQLRQQLHSSFQALGVLKQNGQLDYNQWIDLCSKFYRQKDQVVKPDGYPNQETFNQYLASLQEERPELFVDLSSRGESVVLSDYLYGLGMLMATQPVYEEVFKDDPITYGKGGSVQNGRHRTIVLQVLSQCDFRTDDWIWIKTQRE